MRLVLVDDNNTIREDIVVDAESGFLVTLSEIRRLTESEYYHEINNMCNLIDRYGSFYLSLRFLANDESPFPNGVSELPAEVDTTCR
jgi:hypothetical protein